MNPSDPYFLRLLEAGSSGYSSFSNRYMFWMRRYRTERAVERALRERRRDAERFEVLDIGCSNGSLVLHLLNTVGQRLPLEATGVDISPFDIEFARRQLEFFGTPHCRFEVADGQRLPFPDASFDVVTALEIIEHLAEPGNLLKEMRRVLKPGGAAVLTTPNGGTRLPVRFFRFLNAVTFGALRRVFHLDRRTKSDEQDREILKVTDPHDENTRYKHLSVKGARDWRTLSHRHGFEVRAIRGTGGIIWGGMPLDRHRVIFALSVLLDAVLDLFWCSALWSETLVLDLRKRKDDR